MSASTERLPVANRVIRFDRNEFAGAFGDVGTDLPLIVGMILAAHLDSASVLILFGGMQIATALWYRMPMPVQPLKAVAALVITQKVPRGVLLSGGFAIGVLMLLLTLTGLVDLFARLVPKSVVRGIQFGLGLQLALLALKDYVPADGKYGYVLAAMAFTVCVFLLGNRKYPAALIVIAMGAVYAFFFKAEGNPLLQSFGFRVPEFFVPNLSDTINGLLLLALPQIPLSLGNSILATRQVAEDLFPGRPLPIRRIALTYSLMNLINPFGGGVPTCHGSGGMAGHYAFGGRTGGSVIIYGSMYLFVGLFLSSGFANLFKVFPMPILGVLLLFEALTLLLLVRDLALSKTELSVAVLTGLIACTLPYGYAIALVVGTGLAYLAKAGKTGLGH